MEDKENRQKTVVAFIAGLLIGGILVYIFAAMPDKAVTEMPDDSDTKEVTGGKESIANMGATPTASSDMKPANDANPGASSVTAEKPGSVSVDDQPEGSVVAISSLSMPVSEGWVVVHDVNADGSLGRALGAARYHEKDGLKPVRIELLRATVKDATYQVVIYSENGDKVFDFDDDKQVLTAEGKRIEDSFKALATASAS